MVRLNSYCFDIWYNCELHRSPQLRKWKWYLFFFFLIHKAFTLAGYLKTVKEIMTFEKLRVFYINEYNDYYLKF